MTCRVVRHTPRHCAPAGECVAGCMPCQTAAAAVAPGDCCVPADGSAHPVIVESTAAPDGTPTVVQAPQAAAPQPVTEPLQPLEPIAPVSAEKPLAPTPTPGAVPAADTSPVPQPQFKSAAEILAESAAQERMEQAAIEAAQPPATAAPEPRFKTAAEILAESPAQEEPAAPAPAAEPPMKKVADEQPAAEPETVPEPAAEPTPKKPAPKPSEENLFDEADDAPAADEPTVDKPAPMKKAPADESLEDLFGEPESTKPAGDKAPASKESAEEAPAEEKTEKAEDDPFALLDASPEPVRRWIDSTGRHETIGRLVEVHPDRIRILKSNGRYTTVSIDRLSRHDRSYVTQVGERIAAKRPAVTDTAQR